MDCYESVGDLVCKLQRVLQKNEDSNLRQMIKQCVGLVTELDRFIDKTCEPETEMQKMIQEATMSDSRMAGRSEMLSGHSIGQYLKMHAELVKARTILEIGMFTGYSAVTLAETAFCEELVTLDINTRCEKFVKDRIQGTPLQDKIRIIIGDASQSLETLKNEGKVFDLIFIDADKSGYLNYYKYIMDNGLLSESGIILCDNILWGNDTFYYKSTYDGQALHDFVEFVKNDSRVDQIIVPIRDGLFVIKPKSTHVD